MFNTSGLSGPDTYSSWAKLRNMLLRLVSVICFVCDKNFRNFHLSLKVIYHALFHSVMSYGVIFWGNSPHSHIIFRIQKKAIRIIEGCGNRVSCRNLFKKLHILPSTSQYMLSLLMFVVQNENLFLTNNKNHNLDIRQRNNLHLPQANLTIYQKGAYYSGINFLINYL